MADIRQHLLRIYIIVWKMCNFNSQRINLLLYVYIATLMGGFGKKFKCEECGAKFKTEAELGTHAKRHVKVTAENDTGSGLLPCSTCMEEFETPAELQEHVKQFH